MKGVMRNDNEGFSLIEVAIAIVVIGLIASFALKGKELIHTAKLNAVSDQIESFKIATQMFVEKYGDIPGSLSNAKEIIDDSLENGNGAGAILSTDDAKRFWDHLRASGLLALELINGYPSSKIGGFFYVASNVPGCSGVWAVLTASTAGISDFKGILSQEDAYRLDRKGDTGNPSSGEIRTYIATSSGITPIGQQYDVKNKNKDCIIMFRIW
jgi:prepilin-type N-terminal cleavage/methylation domain-containing protein